jgi:hypothetical protein
MSVPPLLRPPETEAVDRFLDLALRPGAPPVEQALLFGSRARGDGDADSDVDVLLVCDVPEEARHAAATEMDRRAAAIRRWTGVAIEPWTVPLADLAPGGRTPMLVDAIQDAVPLWPADAPKPCIAFTAADARFCAGRLLEWVAEGGGLVAAALRAGRWDAAAARTRDDITRMATAALLLTGDTRHRRRSSLRRFEARFLRTGIASPDAAPAIAWAAAAYPADGGRGAERPPATTTACRSAPRGAELAAHLEASIVPWVLTRIE